MNKLIPTKVAYQRFTKEFLTMEEANEYIVSNPNYSQGGVDVFAGGKVSLTVCESKNILFFPSYLAREEFLEKNNDFNVVGTTLYNGKIAAWVESKN